MVVITVQGRPAAVLMSYDAFLALQEPEPVGEEEVIDIEDWRREGERRARARESVLSLFDVGSLSRKGQKRYKRERVRGLKK